METVLFSKPYLQCPKCKKVFNIEIEKTLHVFSSLNDYRLVLHGNCPMCGEKFETQMVNPINCITKNGLIIDRDSNGDLKKITLWKSEQSIITKVPKTETKLYTIRVDVNKHRYHSFYKRNGKLVKKSLKFNSIPSNTPVWSVDITSLLENEGFFINNKEFNDVIKLIGHTKEIGILSTYFPKVFKFANIKVGGVRVLNFGFNRNQVCKIVKYAKQYNNNIPPKKFVEALLYGNMSRYTQPFPYKRLLKLTRLIMYDSLRSGSVDLSIMLYDHIYKISKLVTNSHILVDLLITMFALSTKYSGEGVFRFVERLIKIKQGNAKAVLKLLVKEFMYNTITKNSLTSPCIDYIEKVYGSEYKEYPDWLVADTYYMIVTRLRKDILKKALPILQEHFKHNNFNLKELHDFLFDLIPKLENSYVEYEYTDFIKDTFTMKIDDYTLRLPEDTNDLYKHGKSQRNCVYSAYKDRHNEQQLIVFMEDHNSNPVATIRFTILGKKKFSDVKSVSDVRSIILTEAKLTANRPVNSNPIVRDILLRYIMELKKKIGKSKFTVRTRDLILN